MKARTFAVLGVSGSGKDTQAGFLLKVLPKARRISTGDGLRRMAGRSNAVGRFAKRVIERGGLFPAWTPIYLWLSEFIEKLDGDESVIFTSGPRRLEEAAMLDAFLRDIGRPAPVAIYLKLSSAVAKSRLLARGRSDDSPRAIANRITFFKHNVQPVIRYFQRRGRLIVVDGMQPIPEVWREIKKKLQLQ